MRFRGLFVFGLTLPLGLATLDAHAEEPGAPSPAPAAAPADLPPPAARATTIVAGVVTTAVSYGLGLSASYLIKPEDLNGAKDLRIPIAGPWLELGKTGCPTSDPGCSKVQLVIGAILTIFDGVAQAGGLGIIGEGLFLNTSSVRPAAPKAEAGPTARRYATGPTVRAVPLDFGKDGVGLGFVGTF